MKKLPSHHKQFILVCALRYALGRRTYAPSSVCEYIMNEEFLAPRTRHIMIRDIEECKDYGMECDKEEWLKLLKYLKELKFVHN